MKFCAKLCNEINFEPHSISPCCNTRNLTIPAFPYNGGQVDLKAYGAHIAGTIASLQENGPVCQGCPELVDIDGLPKVISSRFRAVSINMHRHFCNCRCVYCGLWNQPDKSMGYDILPALQSLQSGGALRENCFISWGGGEPGILPTFENAANWALENGFFQLVHTNAIRYSPVIMKLLQSGRGNINVSLDSGSPETYKKVKGVDCFHKVLDNLTSYAAAGANNIELKYIVFDKNNSFAEIDRFLQIARKLKIDRIEYSLNFVEINAGNVSDKTLLAAAFLEAQAKHLGLGNVTRFFIDPVWQARIDALLKKL